MTATPIYDPQVLCRFLVSAFFLLILSRHNFILSTEVVTANKYIYYLIANADQSCMTLFDILNGYLVSECG